MEVALARVPYATDFNVPGEIMEEKPVFKIGDRVDQMCISCNEVRGHIVVSVTKAGKITRVGCPMCASRVMYRAGTTRRRPINSARHMIGRERIAKDRR